MIEIPFGAAIALACFLLIAGGLAGYRLSWMDAYEKATKDFELARLLHGSGHVTIGPAVSTWPPPTGGSARIVGVGHTVADNATAPRFGPLD